MLKLWITYKILDASIESLFSNISNHFIPRKILYGKDVCDKHVGCRYTLIENDPSIRMTSPHINGTFEYIDGCIVFVFTTKTSTYIYRNDIFQSLD